MEEEKSALQSARKWVVEHKLRAVGTLWLSGIVGSIAYNWSRPGMKTSVKLIHARGGRGGGGGREAGIFGSSAASMLPADELFSGGKLVPLRVPAPASAEEVVGALPGAVEPAAAVPVPVPMKRAEAEATKQAQEPETPLGDEEKGAAEEPKIPARRWRDLLRLRKQQASSSGPADPPLRRLLRRGSKPPEPEHSLSLPLLRESDEKTSLLCLFQSGRKQTDLLVAPSSNPTIGLPVRSSVGGCKTSFHDPL